MTTERRLKWVVVILIGILGAVLARFYDFVIDQRSADLALIYAELNANRAFQREAEKHDEEINRKLTVLDYKVDELLGWKKETKDKTNGAAGYSAAP